MLAALFSRLVAQTPELIIAYKSSGFQQTSATALESFQPGYAIEVDFPLAVSTATQVQLFGPRGTTVSLTRSSTFSYYREEYFASEAGINAALPDGDYTVMVSGGGTTTNTALSLQGGASYQPVLIKNYAELQNWNGGAVAINWEPFVTGTSDDYVLLTIERANGTTVYSSPDASSSGTLTGASTTVTASGFTATPGEVLYGHLVFLRLGITSANAGRTAVASGSGFYVRFPITRAAPTKPVISAQPQPLTVALGSTAVLNVGATGTGLSYQWKKNGVPISGATNASYIIVNSQAAVTGSYTVDITNAGGTVTSASALLSVTTTADTGRLINLSILTSLASAGDNFTVGTIVGGTGTSGAKPLLVRAGGPTLGTAPFNLVGALSDPKLDLFSGQTVIATNDNWGGDTNLVTAIAQVGAFPYSSAASRDSAVAYTANLTTPPASYTVQVAGVSNATGTVIAEIYDATPPTSFTVTTPRLINVSVLKNIGTGLTAGFVIGGATAKTVLIRAIGPTLGAFGVPGVLADPKLELFSGATGAKINENDNWGGDTSLAGTFLSVGAFVLPSSSRDAALLVTLAPGSYTAQVSGVTGASGTALVEVYEVP